MNASKQVYAPKRRWTCGVRVKAGYPNHKRGVDRWAALLPWAGSTTLAALELKLSLIKGGRP